VLGRLTVLVSAAAAVATVATLAVPAVAQAAAAPSPVGLVGVAKQDTFNHRVHVTGWAYDRTHPSTAVTVRIYADGHGLARVKTTHVTPNLDRHHKITGKHGFSVTVSYKPTARKITVRSAGATSSAKLTTLATASVKHVQPAAGSRIVTVAKRYVGHARYREGGASPKSGFDCSGYTKYAFAVAKVATLPHNAESQRRMKRMHAVSAKHARAGDLVFYLSGGHAYHVAIYAGHGMQYAAATPRDGIRYQHVWSNSVQYRRYV